ncbi:unnamed protein product, partial [Ectocarpus sp. 12 AP-2014]
MTTDPISKPPSCGRFRPLARWLDAGGRGLRDSASKKHRFRSRWNRSWPVVVRDSAPGRTNQGGCFRLDFFACSRVKRSARETWRNFRRKTLLQQYCCMRL